MTVSRARGFTLVEVVVAISILSMLVLATVTGMRSLALTQQKLEAKAGQVAQMVAVSRYLRSSIGEARRGVGPWAVDSAVHFIGGREFMQWVSPMPVPNQQGLWVSRLEWRDNQLLIRFKPGIEVPEWSEDDLTYVLASDVEEFALAYRKSVYADWQPDLTGGEQALAANLPSHVRLQLKVAGRYWPEIIIQLQRSSR